MSLVVRTVLTLIAFAGNSLLCRAALGHAGMDAASFTWIRLASGALLLTILLRARKRPSEGGTWTGAAALVAYAILFSVAYRTIPAGVGALVLFASVQFTMLTAAVREGAGPSAKGWVGVALAMAGLVALTLPGATAPDPFGVAMMAASGIGWGVYSLLGRGVRDPVAAIGSSFVRGTLLALPICALLLLREPARLETNGILLAVTSGAVTSGLGYVLWYSVLPHLGTTRASVLQLAVPVIAAAAGALFLREPVTLRLVAASATIIGGIAIVIATRSQSRG